MWRWWVTPALGLAERKSNNVRKLKSTEKRECRQGSEVRNEVASIPMMFFGCFTPTRANRASQSEKYWSRQPHKEGHLLVR